jgi:hypothetical protein
MFRPKKVKRLYGKKKKSRKFGSSNYHSLRLLDLSNPDCPEYDHTMTMSKLTCRELLSQIRPFVRFHRIKREKSFSFPVLKARDCEIVPPFQQELQHPSPLHSRCIEFPILQETEIHMEHWMEHEKWIKRGRFWVREEEDVGL